MLLRAHKLCMLLVMSFSVMLTVSSCRTRKVAVISQNIVPSKPPEDRTVQELLDKIEQNSFNADWLTGKASVTTKSEDNENSFTINLRMRRDSILWISVSPLLGIEVARVLVTPDSVRILDRLHGKYEVNTFESINKLLQLKVNFEMLQDIITGNFFAYRKSENRFNSVYLEDRYYILSSLTKKKLKRSLEDIDPNKPVIQDVYVDESNYRIIKMKVNDQRISKSLETDYSDFRATDRGVFPYKSVTHVTAEKNLDVTIEFSKLSVGEPQEFPFNVPKGYERKN